MTIYTALMGFRHITTHTGAHMDMAIPGTGGTTMATVPVIIVKTSPYFLLSLMPAYNGVMFYTKASLMTTQTMGFRL